jgi:hypothetical protein
MGYFEIAWAQTGPLMKRTSIVAIIVVVIVVIAAGVYLGTQKSSNGGGITPAGDNPATLLDSVSSPTI